jgi:hypothetical protein
MCTLISIPRCAGRSNSRRTMVTCLLPGLCVNAVWCSLKAVSGSWALCECVCVSSWGRVSSGAFVEGWGRNKELKKWQGVSVLIDSAVQGPNPSSQMAVHGIEAGLASWLPSNCFQMHLRKFHAIFFHVAPALTIQQQLFFFSIILYICYFADMEASITIRFITCPISWFRLSLKDLSVFFEHLFSERTN